MKEIFERVHTAWAGFFSLAEMCGEIAKVGFIWLTSPVWIIPYSVHKKLEAIKEERGE